MVPAPLRKLGKRGLQQIARARPRYVLQSFTELTRMASPNLHNGQVPLQFYELSDGPLVFLQCVLWSCLNLLTALERRAQRLACSSRGDDGGCLWRVDRLARVSTLDCTKRPYLGLQNSGA